jgi:hypothetical protein
MFRRVLALAHRDKNYSDHAVHKRMSQQLHYNPASVKMEVVRMNDFQIHPSKSEEREEKDEETLYLCARLGENVIISRRTEQPFLARLCCL